MVPESVLQIFFFILGFFLLTAGANFLVDGASGIAEKAHVSPFAVGLTVVAIGTSLPEVAVSIASGVIGNGEIIIGNVLGSNIMNIFLILGLCSLICALPVKRSSRLAEIPFLLAATVCFILLGYFGDGFKWWDGLILLVLYAVFIVHVILMARGDNAYARMLSERDAPPAAGTAEDAPERKRSRLRLMYDGLKSHFWAMIVLAVIGIAMIIFGAEFVVDSAEYIAIELFDIPESVVALSVVALGTSLPELITCVSAARKRKTDIVTGNIIGSNVANILLVASLGFLCSSQSVSFVLSDVVDAAVSLAAAVVLLAFSFGRRRSLGKASGAVMLCCFAGYYSYLFLTVLL